MEPILCEWQQYKGVNFGCVARYQGDGRYHAWKFDVYIGAFWSKADALMWANHPIVDLTGGKEKRERAPGTHSRLH